MLIKNWPVIKVKDLKPYITSGSRGWAEHYADAGDTFIRITNLQRERIALDFSDLKYVQLPPASQEGTRTRLQDGDILISITADLGLVGYFSEKEGESFYINQHIALLRLPANAIHRKYAAYFLASPLASNQFQKLNDSGSKASLNLGAIERLEIPLPSEAEQRRIVNIFETWDSAIEKLETLIEVKQQRKKVFMQRLLTGRIRFSGFTTPWRCVSISQMGQVISGGTPDTGNAEYWGGHIPWVTPTEITALRNRYLSKTSRTITESGLTASAARLLPKGAIIVCTRATIGACAIATENVCTNQGFKSIVLKEGFDSEFIYYLLSANKHRLIKLASGSTFLEITKSDFEDMDFNIPDIEEQRKIAAVFSAADTELESTSKALDRLKQQKKALMQQLLTGKKRLCIEEVV